MGEIVVVVEPSVPSSVLVEDRTQTVIESTSQLVVQQTVPPTILEVETITPVVVLASGPRGEQGPPHNTSALTAGAVLSGHRAVRFSNDTTVVYASSSNLPDAVVPIGLTLGAALMGDSVEVQFDGEITEPSWSWTPNLPIFLGVNGVLTQTPPVSLFVMQIATALTATSIYWEQRTPIVTCG